MMKTSLRTILTFLTDLIFPRTCALCGMRLGLREHCVCLECGQLLPRYDELFYHASERLLGSPLFSSLSAPFTYQHGSAGYKLIIALKYRGYAEVADFIVRTALTEGRLQPALGSIDFILPVPIEDTRLEKRGYNQAALLAQALSTQYYHVPCREDFLLRHRKSHSQTTLHREERMENARKAFYLTPRRELLDELKGKRILLVDDILTTGSTLLSLCDLLESCGVREVHIFVSAVALPRL